MYVELNQVADAILFLFVRFLKLEHFRQTMPVKKKSNISSFYTAREKAGIPSIPTIAAQAEVQCPCCSFVSLYIYIYMYNCSFV